MQLGIHSLYISGKLGIYPPLHVYNTHIPSCIVTHFLCVYISPFDGSYKQVGVCGGCVGVWGGVWGVCVCVCVCVRGWTGGSGWMWWLGVTL